jgi:hypothetical protein
MRNVKRGMGMKADDKYTIPLCHAHHSKLHLSKDGETAYLASKDVLAPVELAERLYEASDDEYEGLMIIMNL